MGKPRFLLDSNAIINTLNRKLDLLAYLDTFPDCEIYINPLIKIEVLAKADMSEHEEAEARALLDSFKLAEIDNSICEIAIQIRRSKELRLPDAIIAASAIALNATVLSDDLHLLNYKCPGYAVKAIN